MSAPLARDIIEAIRGRRINYNPFPISITQPQFGAVADANGAGGGTDNSAAINNAMLTAQTLGLGSVLVPPGAYRCASGITHPTNVRLYSEGFIAGSPAAGTRFVFDLAVPTCYTIGSASLLSATVDGITITRSSGAIPAGSIGILVNTGYNISLMDIVSDRSAITWKFLSVAPNGIATMLTRCYSSGATDTHIEIDGWPELRWSQGRIGANGSNNFAADSYVRFKNTGGGATYPNGLEFHNVQFNQGSNPPVHWLNFSAVGANAVIYKFIGCHIENLTGTYLTNNASSAVISRTHITNCTFNTAVPFSDFDPSTQLNELIVVGNTAAWTTLDLSNLAAINNFILTSNSISGCTATLNSSAGISANAVASLSANNWFAGSAVTLTGDKWTSLTVNDNFSSNSTLTNNATGKGVSVLTPNKSLSTWTPVLSFGGSSTGITYSTQSGATHITGSMVTYQFRIVLTSKGAQVGTAEITGFPVSQNAATFQTGGGGIVTQSSNMAALNAAPVILNGVIGAAPAVVQLIQQGAAATSVLTDANFTNTSNFSGQVSFFS